MAQDYMAQDQNSGESVGPSKIVFQRGRRDELLIDAMPDACLDALIGLLERQLEAFAVAVRAALRDPRYEPMLLTLQLPTSQVFFPGWKVYWRIAQKSGVAQGSPSRLEDYLLQVELLRRIKSA